MRSLFAALFILATLTASATGHKLIEVTKFINHTAADIERSTKAVAKIEETVHGQCFKEELLERPLIQTNGKSNQEVLDAILTANVKVRLKMYYSLASTVGYTYSSTDMIWTNSRFHRRMDPCDVGANLAHEALGHKLGFTHDKKATKLRRFSVPYSIGELVDKCCKEDPK